MDTPADMPQIDAKHLSILERVQPIARVIAGFSCLEQIHQFRVEFGTSAPICQRFDIAEHWKQIVMLQPEEILPQEVADAQDLSERLQHFLPFERYQSISPVRALEELFQKQAKVQQGVFGIG